MLSLTWSWFTSESYLGKFLGHGLPNFQNNKEPYSNVDGYIQKEVVYYNYSNSTANCTTTKKSQVKHDITHHPQNNQNKQIKPWKPDPI